MSGNDLDAPLGYAPDSDSSRAGATRDGLLRDIPWGALALSGMGVIAISLVAFVMVTEEPAPTRALASLEPNGAKYISVPELPSASAAPKRNEDATASIGRTIRTSQLDKDGVQVVRRAGGDGSESIIIRVPDEVKASLSPAPDARLIAPGPHGALPRIGRDGARPSDVYARPVILGPKIAAGAPRIAIVITGMGLNQAASSHALDTLPAAVTFAFAPHGDRLEDQAEQARAAGHELLLQAPMEGFADSHSAGPRSLAAQAPRERLLDSLHWHMSRFSGYIGLTNFLGARFMSTPQAFTPVLQEIADRGLVFLDDGTSPQSLTLSLAAAIGARVARADISIDGAQKMEGIDAALRRLEVLARERGSAIVVASALPQNVDRINRFAQGLEARGVALVPVSALIQATARTSAR